MCAKVGWYDRVGSVEFKAGECIWVVETFYLVMVGGILDVCRVLVFLKYFCIQG